MGCKGSEVRIFSPRPIHEKNEHGFLGRDLEGPDLDERRADENLDPGGRADEARAEILIEQQFQDTAGSALRRRSRSAAKLRTA
jgi:hypothetical protein